MAVLALVFLALGSQARAFLPGRVLSPADALFAAFPWKALRPASVAANPVLTDVAFQLHPWLLHVAGEIRHGHFPLWNPSVFTGAPLFANPNSAVLFPLNALAYLLPIGLALALGAALKLLTAGLGMYWLLRLLAVGPLGAFTGAAAFMLNGALVAWLQYPVGSAIAFLPLLLAQPMLRANYAFRAVRLGPGTHEVAFEYRPASVRIGLAVSLAAAAVAVGLVLGSRLRGLRRREPQGQPEPRRRAGWAALALLLSALVAGALLLGSPGPTLPRAPFDFEVAPSTVREGVPATIRMRHRGPGHPEGSRPLDLYIASLEGWESAVFLTPGGAWSARPEPYRRAPSVAGLAPVETPWPWERKVGSLRLALVVVDASADPRSRAHWVFQPVLAMVDLRAAITEDLGRARAAAVLGTLALLTIGAVLGAARCAGTLAPPSEPRCDS